MGLATILIIVFFVSEAYGQAVYLKVGLAERKRTEAALDDQKSSEPDRPPEGYPDGFVVKRGYKRRETINITVMNMHTKA